jgi:hypothetical protein
LQGWLRRSNASRSERARLHLGLISPMPQLRRRLPGNHTPAQEPLRTLLFVIVIRIGDGRLRRGSFYALSLHQQGR